MDHDTALATFIATHGTNAPGIFINMADDMAAGRDNDDEAFHVLYADVRTDSDVDEIVDEIADYLGDDDDDEEMIDNA